MSDPTPPNPKRSAVALLAPALSLLLLVGMALSHLRLPTPGDAEPYHTAIRAATLEPATAFDGWQSVPIELPEAARELLKLNASVCRSFLHADRNLAGEFLLVQCKDARDLSGHWPPNCYKANGYTQQSAEPVVWQLDGRRIEGMRYHFVRSTATGYSGIVVDNFMILPGVGYVPDMHSVREAGADYTRRYLGAAQVQVVTSDLIDDGQRQTVFDELVGHYLPLIEKVAQPSLATDAASS